MGNYFVRNSDCTSGGEKITINIERPVNHFVTGIKVVLIPFVPEQDVRKDAFLTPLEKRENFKKISSKINCNFKVNPEFSYLISVAFTTDYGQLTPSDNVTSPGEFERMMKSNIGCYVKNDFYFKNHTPSLTVRNVDTSIECAMLCYNSTDCTEGWSYQQATETCLFITENENITILQPSSHVLKNEKTIGWATGLKSCNEPGDKKNEDIFSYLLCSFVI